MDSRAARRTAEKAARDLITRRTAVIGDLAVAHADTTRVTDEIATATERGRQLVAAAETEAARLLDAAQQHAADAAHAYTDAYTTATSAGWTTADLTALGFTPTSPRPDRPSRRRSPGNQPTHPSDPGAATPTTTPTTTPSPTAPASDAPADPPAS